MIGTMFRTKDVVEYVEIPGMSLLLEKVREGELSAEESSLGATSLARTSRLPWTYQPTIRATSSSEYVLDTLLPNLALTKIFSSSRMEKTSTI